MAEGPNEAFCCGDDGPRDAKEKAKEEDYDPFPLKNDRAQLWKSLCDADELERRQRHFDTAHWNDDASNIEDDSLDTATFLLPNQQRILDYNLFLQNQRYYDDLKHVDHRFIDFGATTPMDPSNDATTHSASPLIIEQDKALGKGGFCWDAAFILGEYIVSQLSSNLSNEFSSNSRMTLVELGCGTGLCGIYIARFLPKSISGAVTMHLTDMAGPIQALMQRNLRRNMDYVYEDELQEYLAQQYPMWKIPSTTADMNASSSAIVEASVLDWDDFASPSYSTFKNTHDIVFGSDVVATLYNPVHLANTIYCLCHSRSMVYISFKERLSRIHDSFHTQMRTLFRQVDIISTQNISRNRNPDVYILIAQHRIDVKPSS
jgi:Lysine methyltransferase